MDNLIELYSNRRSLDFIREEIDKVSHIITDTEKLEKRIYDQLEKARYTFSQLRRIVGREIDLAKKQFRNERTISFSKLAVTNDFGESLDYEPKDVLANVSETVVKNIWQIEKIGSLAATDRDKFTLSAWMDGYNDLEISSMLAHRFGGIAESHRKSIQRLRAKCRKIGYAAVV